MSDRLNQYPLFVGLTRPAMVFGVTYEAFIFIGGFALIGFLGTGNFLMILLGLPFYFGAKLICQKEPRAFSMLFTWLNTKLSCLNRKHWNASSYSPNGTRLCKRKKKN